MGQNFLEDFGKSVSDAVGGAVKGVEGAFDSVVHAGNDAAHAVDQATKNTLQFAGSGINSAGKVVGPVADMFGSDPLAFVMNVAKQTSKASGELLRRVAKRTGKLSYTFPTLQGDRKVAASPPTNASVAQIALTLALCALDAPATMQEEAGRMANGLPVKPRGLSGYTVFPLSLQGSPRGIFGIDDAIVLGIITPILAAIAAAILPGLIAAASGVITALTGGNKETPEAAAAAAAQQKAAETQHTLITVGVVVGVLVLGGGAIYMAVRHKRAA